MADNSFDRTIINLRERPLSVDINQEASQVDRSIRDLLDAQTLVRTGSGVFPDAALSPRKDGFYGAGFKVRPNPAGADGNVYITSGVGFMDNAADLPVAINGVLGLNDLARLKPIIITSAASESAAGIPVPAAPAVGNSRIDIIEVRANRVVTNPINRDVLNPMTGIFTPAVVNKTLQWLVDNTVAVVQEPDVTTVAAIKYKKGVVAVTTDPLVPAVPATTPGYIKIAEVFVLGGSTTYGAGVIKDNRPLILPYGRLPISCTVRLEKPGGTIQGTISNVVAPPGVVVAATGDADDLLSIFISPGEHWLASVDGNGCGTVTATVTEVSPAQIATFGGVYMPAFNATLNGQVLRRTLSAANATQLATLARTNPAVTLAVGQKVVEVQLQLLKFLVATGAPSSFSMSGGGNFWVMNVDINLIRLN